MMMIASSVIFPTAMIANLAAKWSMCRFPTTIIDAHVGWMVPTHGWIMCDPDPSVISLLERHLFFVLRKRREMTSALSPSALIKKFIPSL
ncbi:hypothetical protein BKA57DRAFT_471290 [Linnemannia elongata]|nr:hypothetical protein BKA57DRAFT_471290 [Linnemannia elongata]